MNSKLNQHLHALALAIAIAPRAFNEVEKSLVYKHALSVVRVGLRRLAPGRYAKGLIFY